VSSPENGDAWTEVMATAAVRRAEVKVKRDILVRSWLILEIGTWTLKLKLKLMEMYADDLSPSYIVLYFKCWRYNPMSLMCSTLGSTRSDSRLSSEKQDVYPDSEATMLRLRPWRCPDRYAGMKLNQAFLEKMILT